MPRKPRLELEGGLYHVIARGNDRQDIFHSVDDHKRFLWLLGVQKQKLPFYLYAYCLMTNHFHVLLERQAEPVGRIMQRVLTGYSQYYNRKYRKVGHVFQGRYKAILCQSDRYLTELVRYIHLNPVRARMVRKAERYPHSSLRAYLGMEEAGIVDVDPVLRHFGAKKEKARENFAVYSAEGARLGHQDSYYETDKAGILGTGEFVDETIHRLGETERKLIGHNATETRAFDADALIGALEKELDLGREHFYGSGKNANAVTAKELLIFAGRQAGARVHELARITGLDPSTVSRRYDALRAKLPMNEDLQELSSKVSREYERRIG